MSDIELIMALSQARREREGLAFITESNRIEGIEREPTKAEVKEYHRFMDLEKVTVRQLERFVSVYQPGAVLRREAGMNVRVGNHVAPPGGPDIERELKKLLKEAPGLGPYRAHVLYEKLHPFTDGNGRSGRMLWRWMVPTTRLSFLHWWYYASLSGVR